MYIQYTPTYIAIITTICLKKRPLGFLLEPIIVIFGTQYPDIPSLNICIISHLTLVVLLHYLRMQEQPNRHVVFLLVGGSEETMDNATNCRPINS